MSTSTFSLIYLFICSQFLLHFISISPLDIHIPHKLLPYIKLKIIIWSRFSDPYFFSGSGSSLFKDAHPYLDPYCLKIDQNYNNLDPGVQKLWIQAKQMQIQIWMQLQNPNFYFWFSSCTEQLQFLSSKPRSAKNVDPAAKPRF